MLSKKFGIIGVALSLSVRACALLADQPHVLLVNLAASR